MSIVQNLVPISDFRANLSTWLGKLDKKNKLVILQNSRPKAVVLDPEYFDYLIKYASGFYDKGDIAEVERAIKNGEDKTAVTFNASDYE